jgi:hypothetical protein
MFHEEPIAQVVGIYLVSEVFPTVAIGSTRGGLHFLPAILTSPHVWVIERVDVYGQAAGMIGEVLAAGDPTEAEATGVVVSHLALVIGIIVISQAYPLDRVVLAVEFHENTDEPAGDKAVADHLPVMSLTVIVPVQQFRVTEVFAPNDIIRLIGLALHPMPDAVRDLIDRKAIRNILALRRINAAEPEKNNSQ